MPQLPIWLWVVSVVGVIATGIGLGYLLIYLFWRVEKFFFPEVASPKNTEPEIKVEEPVIQPEPVEEEIVPILKDAISSELNRLVKFTYILNSKFKHPFEKANTIVCWDLTLENGDEVRDILGNQMKLKVTKPTSEAERIRYTLTDKSGHHTISIISSKEYLERETKFDFDKVKTLR